jgi:hypothetical protein
VSTGRRIWKYFQFDYAYCFPLFVHCYGEMSGKGPNLFPLLVPLARSEDRVIEFDVVDLELWSKATSKVTLVSYQSFLV